MIIDYLDEKAIKRFAQITDCDLLISEIDFPARLTTIINRYRIETIAELLFFSEFDFLNIRGIGKEIDSKVRARLKENGIDVEEVKKKSILYYHINYCTAIKLINAGIIKRAELEQITAIDLFNILNDYYLTKTTVNELKKLDCHLKPHYSDCLLFETHLSGLIQSKLVNNKIYQLSTLIENKDNLLDLQYIGKVYAKIILEFINEIS